MFTTIGYIWRPTGRTFTIIGNVCPLTRITTTTEAPFRKLVVLDNETSKPVVTLVYLRKPRNSKTNVPVSKSKVLQSVSANKKEPSVESSNSVRRPKSKDTKSKDRVLKNNNDKRPSTHVRKMSSSVSIDSNKHETMHSNVCQSNASVLSTKTVNSVNDGSNIVCVSYGKDVFLLSHEKCVACYALSRNSSVKRTLFTTLIALKSKNLGATSVVVKSRLSVAKTLTATNKVSSVLPLSPDSIQSRKLKTKTQVCLLCEEILKQIPSFNFFSASFKSITAIEITWKWVKEWDDTHLGNMLVLVTSGDARSSHIISRDAKSWDCFHIFTVILVKENDPLRFKIYEADFKCILKDHVERTSLKSVFEIMAAKDYDTKCWSFDATAAPSRGRTGGRTGRGSGRTEGRSGDQGDGRIDGQAQVGDQGRGQGNGRNQNRNVVNDNIRGDIEKMESVQDMSGCRDNQKVKYTTGLFVGKALMWWNSQIHTRGREAAVETELWNHAMVGAGHAAYTDRFHELASNRAKYHLKAVQIAGTLPDEALRNGSIKKNPEKRGNRGEPSKDMNVRDDNKRTRTGNAFATTTNPVGRENTGTVPNIHPFSLSLAYFLGIFFLPKS
ncbi:hypothetical protein Tco_0586183 [Tanacetum coccineum]